MYNCERNISLDDNIMRNTALDLSAFFKEHQLLRMPSEITEIGIDRFGELKSQSNFSINYVDSKVDHCYMYMLNCKNILLLPESIPFELFALFAFGFANIYTDGILSKDFRLLVHSTTNMHGLIMLNQFINRVYKVYRNNKNSYYKLIDSVMVFDPNKIPPREYRGALLGKIEILYDLSHNATNASDVMPYIAKRIFPDRNSLTSIRGDSVDLFQGETLLCDKIYKIIL